MCFFSILSTGPLWRPDQEFCLYAFLSPTSKFSSVSVRGLRAQKLLLLDQCGLVHDETQPEIKLRLNLVDEASFRLKNDSTISASSADTSSLFSSLSQATTSALSLLPGYDGPDPNEVPAQSVAVSSKFWRLMRRQPAFSASTGHQTASGPTAFLHVIAARAETYEVHSRRLTNTHLFHNPSFLSSSLSSFLPCFLPSFLPCFLPNSI